MHSLIQTAKRLTEDAYHFTAGILNNARGFTAVCNPLVNSYKRLVPGYEAPCYIAWSGKTVPISTCTYFKRSINSY